MTNVSLSVSPSERGCIEIEIIGGLRPTAVKNEIGARFATPSVESVLTHAIARGRITVLDASIALKVPGVLQVFTHENAPRVARADSRYVEEVGPPGTPFRPFENADITFSLCLPAASYITGAVIPVDGGLTIRNA